MRRRGHPRRLPDLPDRHRAGGDPPRRHRDDRGDPRAQAALPGGADHAGPLQHLLRPQPGRPPGAQLGVPARVRQGRARLGDRARLEDPADVPDPGRAARGRARPGLRPPPRGLRPAAAVPRAVRGRRRRLGAGSRGPRSWPRCRCTSGCERRIIDGERNGLEADLDAALADRPAAGDHQRHAAVRHEDGRRAVRLRADAAAVRAAVGRGDEDRGGLPRAAHGEVRRRRQGHASCSPRSRATCTTSARTWSTSSCPTTATRSSTSASSSRSSAILDAAEEHEADVDRHVRPAGEVHGGHEGEPRGDELRAASPSGGRCCSAAPR